MAQGKRFKKASEGVDRDKFYPLEEAVKMIKDRAKAKFDETIELALNLGVDPEVVFELVKERASRDDIWMQINGKNEFQSVGKDATEMEVASMVVGWNERSLFRQEIRNYTAKPIQVEIRRSFDGHQDFRSLLEPKLHDYQTVEFSTRVEPGAKRTLRYEVVRHPGRNAKQNSVKLEQAEVN